MGVPKGPVVMAVAAKATAEVVIAAAEITAKIVEAALSGA
jgi:hypothetical protein